MNFTETEKKILRIVQGNLPSSLSPFREIATECGVSEEEVLQFLNSLLDKGPIRRFGASIYHQKAGWSENAMVAWIATLDEAESRAATAMGNNRISHMYFRPSVNPDWPYTFYTMIHGQSREDIDKTVNGLAADWNLPYAILRSKRELKKTSPIYF